MVVVVITAVTLGALLLWALYTEPVAPPPRPSHTPAWTGLPDPTQIVRRDFPLVPVGYDPAAVQAHLRAVARAYAAVRAGITDTPPAGVPGPPPDDGADPADGDGPAVAPPPPPPHADG